LGGDQSISIGTLAGLASKGTTRGIIWIDAHGDFNTPLTTPSDSIHGMALAAILGYGDPRLATFGGVSPKALEHKSILIGGRSFDDEESRALLRSKVIIFTMKDVDQLGMRAIMRQAIQVASDGVRDVHLSFDIDALDPGRGARDRYACSWRFDISPSATGNGDALRFWSGNIGRICRG
jgi:arginase